MTCVQQRTGSLFSRPLTDFRARAPVREQRAGDDPPSRQHLERHAISTHTRAPLRVTARRDLDALWTREGSRSIPPTHFVTQACELILDELWDTAADIDAIRLRPNRQAVA